LQSDGDFERILAWSFKALVALKCSFAMAGENA
jgi:hypothetical protein